MENKIKVMIMVFASINIILGLMLLKSSIWICLDLRDNSELFKCLLTGFDFGIFMKLSAFLGFFLSLIAIISGIGLIRLNPFMRLIHLILVCPMLVIAGISSFDQWNKLYMVFISLLFIISAIYSCFFLTRPRVKEHFK